MASSNEPFESTLNQFDDIFHAHGDDDDENDDQDIDFYNLAIQMETQDETQVIPISDDDDDDDDDTDIVIVEEEHLSQKFNQLSASQERVQEQNVSTINKRPIIQLEAAASPIKKKIKTVNNIKTDSISKIPEFLSVTNNSFARMITPILLKTPTSSIIIEDLRQIALLMYYLAVNDLLKWQWKSYLLSGMGQFKYQIELHLQDKASPIEGHSFWPSEVKQKLIEKRLTNARNESEIDYDTCRKCLENYLRQLTVNTEHYQTQLNDLKRRLNDGFTEEVEKAIEQFVDEQSVNQIKIKVKGKLAIAEYEYYERLLELRYLRLKPDSYQSRIFKELTVIKREQEHRKYDVQILKQRIFYKQLPDSFNSLQVPPPLSIHTMKDTSLGRQLTNRCQNIIEKTKSDIMAVYIMAAEAEMYESQRKFDIAMDKMRNKQRDGYAGEVLTQDMLVLLQERFNLINQRTKALYNVRVHFFAKAPTVTTNKI